MHKFVIRLKSRDIICHDRLKDPVRLPLPDSGEFGMKLSELLDLAGKLLVVGVELIHDSDDIRRIYQIIRHSTHLFSGTGVTPDLR